jgi:hypothetical protein
MWNVKLPEGIAHPFDLGWIFRRNFVEALSLVFSKV